MKVFVVLALCVASALAGPHGWAKAVKWMDVPVNTGASGRIIGGAPAVLGQFPWQATVIGNTAGGSWLCGGSLINDRWVLTAAHCLGAVTYTIHLGGLTIAGTEAGRTTLTATRDIIHPNYNSGNLNNDIGLIELPVAVQFSDRLQPVALADPGDFVDASRLLTVSGWGRTSDASTAVSQILNFVEVNAITNAQCASVYGTAVVVASTLCTVGATNQGTCSGDSGGPLVSVDASGAVTQVGVVSFGAAAGCELGFPSGFARVQSFLPWINANAV